MCGLRERVRARRSKRVSSQYNARATRPVLSRVTDTATLYLMRECEQRAGLRGDRADNPFPARLSERRAADQRPSMPAFPATTRSYDGLSGTARMPYVPAMLPDRSLAFVPTCVQHTNCCVKTFAESRERVLGSWPQHRHKAGYMASGRVFIHIK